VPLSGGIQTGIGFSLMYDEYEACVAAGLDLEKWIYGDYETAFKNYIIAWFRLHRLVEAHSNDAQTKEMKRKSGK
jgi:hypothetical protein